MSVQIPSVKLSDGNTIPLIGFGTWISPEYRESGALDKALKFAIKSGYRHIDTAILYESEQDIGNAVNELIADGIIKRSDLFITSKCWMNYFTRSRVIECCKKSLASLKTEYLDLYLMHWPMDIKQVDQIFIPTTAEETKSAGIDIYNETWKGMEDCVRLGLVKSIGVSNFNSKQIATLLRTAEIKPVMNQVECHPFLSQRKLIDYCNQRGIKVTAYSAFGGQPDSTSLGTVKSRLVEHPLIIELSRKYNKTVHQILIKYQVQRNVVVIPKSTNHGRIMKNADVFDFELTDEDLKGLESLDCNDRYIGTFFNIFSDHPNYPFNEPF